MISVFGIKTGSYTHFTDQHNEDLFTQQFHPSIHSSYENRLGFSFVVIALNIESILLHVVTMVTASSHSCSVGYVPILNQES